MLIYYAIHHNKISIDILENKCIFAINVSKCKIGFIV